MSTKKILVGTIAGFTAGTLFGAVLLQLLRKPEARGKNKKIAAEGADPANVTGESAGIPPIQQNSNSDRLTPLVGKKL